jgi:hypothetical protein
MDKMNLNYFLIEYIRSLKERSRLEKTGFKNGLDWLILQLGIQKEWLPIRMPFSIEAEGGLRSKTEGELGIDISFLSKNKEDLYIFVLKDEKLNNRNWTNSGFVVDIQKASSPNMKAEELGKVQAVHIITAYNKDHDRNGVGLYENLTNSFSSKFGKHSEYRRTFQRWDLTRIVEEVGKHLITPGLLPNHLISQFRYICSQIRDFDYCSKEWLEQLESNWRDFVEALLGDEINANKINLLALSIYMLKDSWKSEEKSYAGWIDLVEWAMISLWRRYYYLSDSRKDGKTKTHIFTVWGKVYLTELEMYFNAVNSVLRVQHGMSLGNLSLDVNFVPINDSFRAFWHMGRLGLLSIALQEVDFGDDTKEIMKVRISSFAELLVDFMRANPATLRPLIDLHHIELFLVWLLLYQAGREDDIKIWLSKLESVLTIRRYSNAVNLPFIQSNNDLDSLVEYVVRGGDEIESEENSSYLLLMLVELCYSLSSHEKRDELIERFVGRLAKGIDDNGDAFGTKDDNILEPIDLLSWCPPKNWEEKLLSGSLAMEGVGITTGNFGKKDDSTTSQLSDRIRRFVTSMRSKFPPEHPKKLPLSVCVLACLKHKSPLPPEFWRGTTFPEESR